jgi:hypothetical protein
VETGKEPWLFERWWERYLYRYIEIIYLYEKALHYKNNMSCNAAPADAKLMLVVPYVP